MLIKPFTAEFAATPPEAYLRRLADKLHVLALVAGFNFTFGERGRGNADLIRAMAGELSYRAEVIEAVEEGGHTVSSTLIRSLIASGDMLHAQRLLRIRQAR